MGKTADELAKNLASDVDGNLVTAQEAAKQLGVSVSDVKNLVQQEILKEVSPGKFSAEKIAGMSVKRGMSVAQEAAQAGAALQREIAASLSVVRRILAVAAIASAAYITTVASFVVMYSYKPAEVATWITQENRNPAQAIFHQPGIVALGILKYTKPEAYEEVSKVAVIEPTSFFKLDGGSVTTSAPLRIPAASSLQVLTQDLIANLNAEFLQGKQIGTVLGDVAAIGAVGAPNDNSVTTAKLVDGSVTTVKLADGSVTEIKLADGSVTSAKIADGAVGGSELAQITDSEKVAGSAVQLNGSGGLVNNSGLSLITSCGDTEILKWNDSGGRWQCAADAGALGSGLNTIQEEGVTAVLSTSFLNFTGSDFTVTESPANTGNVSIDYTNSKILRADFDATVTGAWTLPTGTVIGSQTFTTNNILDSGALTVATTGTGALTLDSGTTGAVNLGTGSNAKTVTIGNTTGASTLNLRAGSGGITLNGNTTISGTNSFTTGTGTSTFNSALINLAGASTVVDMTGTGTLGLNTTTNRAITTGTGLFTVSGAQTTTGLTTLNGALLANGNITLGSAADDLITFNGVLTGSTPLIFDGSTADANYLSLIVTNPTTSRTATIPLLTADDTFVFLSQNQTLANKTLTSPVLNGSISGTGVDTDTGLTANSNTLLASQRAIKTYVDNHSTGTVFRPSVNLIDFVETDPGANVVGQAAYVMDGVALTNGMRVVFGNAAVPALYNDKVFLVGGVGSSITLTLQTDGQAGNGDPTNGDAILITQGSHTNETYVWSSSSSNWELSGSSSGYLLASNNLSDLASATTARTNLGLGTGDSPAFAGLTINGTISQSGANTLTTGTGLFTASGNATVVGLLTGQAGANISGAVVNLNANSNFAVNLATGTSTGAISIGGGANTVAVNSTTWDISTLGAATGFTGVSSTTTDAITFDSGTTGAVNLGTGANAKTITIGNTTGATTVNINSGSGGIVLGANTTISGSNTFTTGTGLTTINSTAITLAGNSTVLDMTGTGTLGLNTTTNRAITTGTGLFTTGGALSSTGTLTALANFNTPQEADHTTTGTQNNVNLGAGALYRYNGAGAATFTGITGGEDGRIIRIMNASASNLTLNNLDGGSLAANQISTSTGGNLVIGADATVALQYDATDSIWRVVSFPTTSTTVSGFAYVQGGNAFGTTATLGTTDANGLTFITGGANRFSIAAASSTLTGDGATTVTSTGSLALSSAAGSVLTVTSGTTGALTLDSGSTGDVNLGTGANAKNITIGGSGANVIVIGNTQTGGSLTAGNAMTTGTITIGGAAQTGTITLGSSSGANTLNIANGSGATTLNLANAQTGGGVSVGAGMTTGTITIGGTAQTGTITLGSSSGANTLNIANGSGATTLNLANVQNGGAVSMGAGMTTGTITIGGTAQAGTITVGSSSDVNTLNIANGSGATTLNLANVQNGGAVNIGAGMTTGTITIGGTGAQTGTITVGGGTGAQTVNLGTGGTGVKTVHIADGTANNIITIGTGQNGGSIAMGSAMTNGTIDIGNSSNAMTGTINIGGSTGAQTLNFGGGNTGIKTVNIAGGTAANVVNIANAQAGGGVSVGNAMTTGTITIGGTAQTGTITLGSSSDTSTLNIANGSGATTLNLANVQNGGAVNIGAGMTTGTITIGGTGAQTGTISLGTGTGAQTINLGTGGTGAKTVTVGSTASTGNTTIQSGTGNINLQAAGTGATGRVQVGSGAGSSTPDLFVLDIKNDAATDPTGTAGAMYYNSSSGKFRCFENGAWTNCIGEPSGSFTDSTLTGLNPISFSTATEAWDDATRPNITATRPNTKVLVNVVIRGTSDEANDQNPVFIVRTATGANPTCTGAGGTQVGQEFVGNFLTANGQDWGTSASFVYTSTAASGDNLRFTTCTTTTGADDGNLNSVDISLVELGADLAEKYYTTDDTIEEGDLVAIDATLPAGVKKTQSGYDVNTLGVVSTAPGMVLDDAIGINYGRAVPIALAGRVPVKVSTENGPIMAGDHLTASSIPGVAMKATKAGPVIGQAIENYSSNEPLGLVMTFVKTGYFNGVNTLDMSAQGPDSGRAVLAQIVNGALANPANVTSEVITDRVIAGLEIIAPKITTDELVVNKIRAGQIVGLEDYINQTASGSGEATASNNFASNLIANIFKSVAEFFDKVIFHGDATFLGRATFNNDSAGFAVIATGAQEVTVEFEHEYETLPVVTVSPDVAVVYSITDQSVKSFKIKLNAAQAQDIKFSWTATAVKDAKTFVGTLATPTPSSPASPESTPASSPEPTAVPEPTVQPQPSSPQPSSSPVTQPLATPEPTSQPSPSASPEVSPQPSPAL